MGLVTIRGGVNCPRRSRVIRSRVLSHVEPMEQRRLATATVSSWSGSYTTDTGSGAAYFADVLVGDNGYPAGYPTAVTGGSGEASVWEYPTWDTNVDDGFDSGWATFRFGVNTDGDGEAYLQVADGGIDSVAAGNSTIGRVTIQADVAGSSMKMSWADVTVKFYSHGTLVETVSVGSVDADTLASTDSCPAESGVTIINNATSGYDGVLVSGKVRLQAAEGTYPGQTDIFGQVAIS